MGDARSRSNTLVDTPVMLKETHGIPCIVFGLSREAKHDETEITDPLSSTLLNDIPHDLKACTLAHEVEHVLASGFQPPHKGTEPGFFQLGKQSRIVVIIGEPSVGIEADPIDAAREDPRPILDARPGGMSSSGIAKFVQS
jgi:hypothetical protein